MSTYLGKAAEAAAAILAAFENPDTLPGPLEAVFIKPSDGVPCRKWSYRNRFLVALAGHSDARGFRQWLGVGRAVKKGERSFQILAPILRTVRDEETGQLRQGVAGFKAVPVFGLSQTEGQPLPPGGREVGRWVDSLPLIEVARSWGLSVEVFDAEHSPHLGLYRRGGTKGIAVGVQNLSTWAHELMHAADDRLGNLTERGQHWRSETVAQLGAAVLLRLIGHEVEADLGGTLAYVRAYAAAAGLEVVEACGRVLDRTCSAVSLILATGEQLRVGQVA